MVDEEPLCVVARYLALNRCLFVIVCYLSYITKPSEKFSDLMTIIVININDQLTYGVISPPKFNLLFATLLLWINARFYNPIFNVYNSTLRIHESTRRSVAFSQWPSWWTETIKIVCIKINFYSQRMKISLFWPPTWAPWKPSIE